jgi:phytoene dehydrogenase-like protein
MPKSLARLIEDHGEQLLRNAAVTQILVSQRRADGV